MTINSTTTKNNLIYIILLFLCISANAQYPYKSFFDQKQIITSDSGKLFLSIRNVNFFKNNEYFDSIVSGYTLLGYRINPELEYHPSTKSALKAGVQLLKFSGRDGYYKVLPTLTFQQKLTKNLDIVMGTLYGTINHNMPEPVLDPEYYIQNPDESGIQFLFNSNRVKSDIWLNWENFIVEGDTTQEKLTAGTSTHFLVFDSTHVVNIEIPFQTLFTHRGGQINKSSGNIETLANYISGFSILFKPQNSIFKKLAFNSFVLFYTNSSPSKERAFNNGWALYPGIIAETNHFSIKADWWHCNKFIGPRGEMIYQPVSHIKNNYTEKQRDLAIAKFAYIYNWDQGIRLSTGFEGYYDLNNGLFDYNYGVSIVFNSKFFIKQF